MENSIPEAVSSIDSGFDRRRAIDDDRFRRAVEETMVVVFDAPLLARIGHGEQTYTVDLVSGSCECEDYLYRGESVVCKHAIRAALAALFTDVRVTEFVARVAHHARTAGCPEGVRGCRGPTTPAEWSGRLPCATCCDAVRAPGVDEFTVWSAFSAPTPEGDR